MEALSLEASFRSVLASALAQLEQKLGSAHEDAVAELTTELAALKGRPVQGIDAREGEAEAESSEPSGRATIEGMLDREVHRGHVGDGSCDAALAVAMALTKQALEDVESRCQPDAQTNSDIGKALKQLREARKLLAVSSPSSAGAAGPLPSTRQTAKAYDCVRESTSLLKGRSTQPAATCLKLVKGASLIVREFLTLQCMALAPRGAPRDFEAELVNAFDREIWAVESELHSQLHLSHKTICRLGRESKENFDEEVGKIFGRQLGDEHREILFRAYVRVTRKHDATCLQAPARRRLRSATPGRRIGRTRPTMVEVSTQFDAFVGSLGSPAYL